MRAGKGSFNLQLIMVELGDPLFRQFFALYKGLFPFEFGFECLRLPNVGGFVEGSSVKFLILSSRGYFLLGFIISCDSLSFYF